MSFRRSNLGFFILQGFFWASYCPMFGFVVTILLDYGYSPEVCGMVSTLQCIALMIIQPIYGYIIDRITSPKRGFIAIMCMGVVLALPLPWVFTQSQGFVTGYLTLIALFVYSGGPVVDAWTVGVINKTRGMDYALCRGGGSVMYAFSALLIGNMIAPLGIQSLFVLHIVLGIGTIVVAVLLVDSNKLGDGDRAPMTRQKQPSFLQSARVLLRIREYVIFTACMCLYNFGIRAYSTYMAMIVDNVGGSSSHMGLSLFISAFGEIVFMLLASRLMMRGMPVSYLYMWALGILAVRFAIIGVTSSLWLVVITNVIQAAGLGFNLRMNAEHLVHIAPEGYQGMAIMLSGAISIGLGSVLGNLLGGYMIQWWGVQVYSLISAGMFVAGMVVFAPTVWREYCERRLMRQQVLAHRLADYKREEQQ